MTIQNQELKFKIYNRLKKNYQEEITEEELKKIETISIDGKDQDLQNWLFDPKDLSVLKYVKNLTLNLFEIQDAFIEQIGKMKELEVLTFNHCSFTTKKFIKNPLKKVIVTYPKGWNGNLFANGLSIKMIELIQVENVDIAWLTKYKNLKYLYLYNCQMNHFELLKELKNLKEIKLDGSNRIEEVCRALETKGISLSYENEYFPI